MSDPSESAVVVLSGGMDSACALWWAREQGPVAHAISIDYGQRHRKELAFASVLAGIAVAAAGAHGAGRVVYGAHAGDHPIYPDCRPEFVDAMARACGLCWYTPIELVAPFIHKTKADVAALGETLGVPWEKTWSCYEGGDVHCGTCGTCVERREAFHLAGVHDPTAYLDSTPIEQLLEVCDED
jgi:7-cyano-7-deazaguanine synthase in queuosine biosynthesis